MPYKDPEKQKAWRENNRDYLCAQKKAWYQENKHKIKTGKKAPRKYDPVKQRAYYEANQAKILERTKAARLAMDPEKRREWDRFRYRKACETPEFVLQARIRATAWAKANRERYRHNQRNAKVRRRAREAIGQPFTHEELAERINVFGGRCIYCLGPAEHVDHIIPLVLGGRHCLENIAPACADCNLRKKGAHPLAWLSRKREEGGPITDEAKRALSSALKSSQASLFKEN